MNKLIITDDSEQFSPSNCQCQFCLSTHQAVAEWNSFVPETRMQHRMMDVIERIETREREKVKHRIKPKKTSRYW